MTRIFSIFAILSAAGALFGQTAAISSSTVTLAGRVLDESGALVPAAKIELREVSAGRVREAASAADGTYSVTGLEAGRYSVRASTASLVAAQAVEIELRPGVQWLDLQLRIAATAQHLTVEESTALPTVSVDAGTNASATVIKGDDLDSLSDDPEDLQADLEALAGPSAGPGGTQILIDGFTTADLPPKSSIREVRVNQNPFSPDYDRLGLGRVEIFTKPGTDKFHGNLPYNLGTDRWNSRNPYSAKKAPFLLQEFESSFSGPVTKRSSFTLDLEKQNVTNGSITNGVTLEPQTLAEVPFSTVIKTPQRRFLVVPHIDYQISESNFLSVRYNYTQSHVDEAGIGGFDLISRGFTELDHAHTMQLLETSIHGGVVNEARVLYYHWRNQSMPDDPSTSIQVLGAFNGGGLGNPGDHYLETRFELMNYTYVVKGSHSWRFGGRLRGQAMDSYVMENFAGTFTYADIDAYRAARLGLPGAGPSLFTIKTGVPESKVAQKEPAAFVGDDWRVKPNLTASLGLRWESQTNIGDHADIAPRLGIAWSPRVRGGKGPGFVLRGGFGLFYDRFALRNTLNAARDNGVVQREYVVQNPGFTTVPPLASLAANAVQSRRSIYAGARAPYVMQGALTVERQLSKGATLAVTWTNAHGLHQARSEFILQPGQGPVFLTSTSGLYNQNQLIFNLNAKVGKTASVFSSYTFNKAMSDTDGVNTYPGNPYNYAGEYGPASSDIRHRFQFGGSVAAPWGVRLSPLFTWQSGAPFNLTTGTDPYGTSLYFARPGLNGSVAGAIATPYGRLDPNPVPGEATIGRNAGRGPDQVMVNLRVNRTWALRGRSSFSVGLSMRNLLNHTNPGPIIGNITSPLFGQANQIAGNANGQGFSENANNRRLELQVRLGF